MATTSTDLLITVVATGKIYTLKSVFFAVKSSDTSYFTSRCMENFIPTYLFYCEISRTNSLPLL